MEYNFMQVEETDILGSQTIFKSSACAISHAKLLDLLSTGFLSDHEIHALRSFSYSTEAFYGGAEKKLVVPEVPEDVVKERLDTITNILTHLLERYENNKPIHTLKEVYRAYSVIACNWLSIHGCLSIDGHGRSLIQLLPVTLWAGGYPEEFYQEQFLNEKGVFDANKAKVAIVFLNGHMFWDGIRILAARLQLGENQVISDLFMDPRIIGHWQTRKKANSLAMEILKNRVIQYYFNSIRV